MVFVRQKNVFIYIDFPLAMSNGVKFYISDNGILEPKYFKHIVDTKGNNLLTQKLEVMYHDRHDLNQSKNPLFLVLDV